MDRDERIRAVLAELRDTEKRAEALRRKLHRLVKLELSDTADSHLHALTRDSQPFECNPRIGN